MLIVALAIVVAIWAVWVAYVVTREGGYPPYQDNTQDLNPKVSDTWPFPKDRP